MYYGEMNGTERGSWTKLTGCWNLIADIILMHIEGIHLNSTEPLEGGRLCVWKYHTSVLQSKLRICYYLFTGGGYLFVLCSLQQWHFETALQNVIAHI